MVKGISRQVVVVRSPQPKLFEQAIFILREDIKAVSDEQLLKEAKLAVRGLTRDNKRFYRVHGPIWAGLGASAMGLVWLISSLI
jgi:hypothetical protein